MLCSPFSASPQTSTTGREHLPHPNLPRLLPLPHQSIESIHSQPNEEEDGRFPPGAQPSETRERRTRKKDGQWQDVPGARLNTSNDAESTHAGQGHNRRSIDLLLMAPAPALHKRTFLPTQRAFFFIYLLPSINLAGSFEHHVNAY